MKVAFHGQDVATFYDGLTVPLGQLAEMVLASQPLSTAAAGDLIAT